MLDLTREEMAGYEALLREHWPAFCDADPVPDRFIDMMERAGFVKIREVRQADIEDDPFAAERGIEMGGWIWELSASGRAAIAGGSLGHQTPSATPCVATEAEGQSNG